MHPHPTAFGPYAFKVKAGTHYIDVSDGNFHYAKSIDFKKGVSMTINVEQAGFGAAPTP